VGDVRVEIVIDEEGRVQTVNPISGHPLLVSAAQAAVRQWTYQPTLLNGKPVTVMTTVTLTFE
jgi:protein TonB